MNEITAELCHGTEAILASTMKWFAQVDPLMNSRIGRLVRRFIPSPQQKAVEEAKKSYIRNIDEISKRFMQRI